MEIIKYICVFALGGILSSIVLAANFVSSNRCYSPEDVNLIVREHKEEVKKWRGISLKYIERYGIGLFDELVQGEKNDNYHD